MRQIGICVYGGASQDVASCFLQAGHQIGEAIARRGWRLINGGGNTGMMGATIRGALEFGGQTIGIAPYFFRELEALFADGEETLYTRTMRARQAFMESLSDAFIASPGGIGTLEEFYEILTLKQLKQLEAPLVLLNLDGYYTPLLKAMAAMEEAGFIGESVKTLFKVCDSVAETFEYLDSQLK